MGNYVTVAERLHTHWGYDPCPGSPDGSEAFGSQLKGFAEQVEELKAFLMGARSDLDYGGWTGDSQAAFQEAMVDFPPKLGELAGAFDTVQQAVHDWALELRGFQSRSLPLDEALGTARSTESTAERVRDDYLLRRPEGQMWTEDEDIAEYNRLEENCRDAREGVRQAEQNIRDLEQDYRERAEHYGGLINAAGNRSWSRTFWDGLGDIGDWIEDTPLGDIARSVAPAAAWLSKWAGLGSAVLTGLGLVSLAVFPPAAPFLLGGAAVLGFGATAGDVTLAVAGDGGWGPVGMSVVSLGIGKGITTAGNRIMQNYRNTKRADELIEVKTPMGTKEYVPTLFTANEVRDGELGWQVLKMKGHQAQWSITGYGLAQTFIPSDEQASDVPVELHGHESTDPWDLPPNTAYLEDRDGELVK